IMDGLDYLRHFRDVLLIDFDGRPARLSAVADGWQRADFEALDPAWFAVISGHTIRDAKTRASLERPRRHSQTTDLAVMASFALAFGRAGLSGVVAAADGDQAALLRKAIATLIRLNPWLDYGRETVQDGQPVKGYLKADNWKVTNPRTGSTLEIISS